MTIKLPLISDPFNVEPTIWGSGAWNFMHNVSLSYPAQPTEKEKSQYEQFFNSIGSVLPCESCRAHYQEFGERNPLKNALGGKSELVSWVFDAHNNANRLLNKPVFTHSQFIEKHIKPLKEAPIEQTSITIGKILGGGLLFIACIAVIGFSSSYFMKKKENVTIVN